MPDALSTVLRNGMCVGCGLCATEAGEMRMDPSGFLRPVAPALAEARDACPGFHVAHHNDEAPYHLLWGPIRSCEVGYATDAAFRHAGSSGGVVTTLLRFLLESGRVDGVVQIGAATSDPLRNETYVHASVESLLHHAGSRYAPSAPLAALRALIGNGRRYAFVGKPCDVAALRAMTRLRPEFREQFPYLLSFMCAGIPGEKGTRAVLDRLGLDPAEVISFRYRGNGWPGLTTAVTASGEERSLTYNEAWGKMLNRHLHPRCKICADGIGEAADVVCADAWHATGDGYPSFDEMDGRSLVLARTDLGEELVQGAVHAGYVRCAPLDPGAIERMQPYQANRKRTALARAAALKLFGVRTTRFSGYRLVRNACTYGLIANAKAFLGTVHRKLVGRI
ncbi:Coenzyme F420 hydrogenase/dehydrogenase, beta subunit C-terminal domain [Starkeya koreensis]|uniref:Coenzyme F420 hydrogenase/dehydrogenase, beta subunit C-terminal domain n=1 Tax=Ancylobacter koreensis TaxID=266121 RepID=A0ABT0DGK7_9HYPH|nr:Coenzyme F420 hydrogenase/dehydrogenase, beta subunit C-terminal domain [Ancylobacter koreensis]MCK0206415.1 Coenzyme F420 hydrogenase/dehydrogenase, beta subunit C-terminal domain [Ancylobacter koreensis]